MVMIASLVFTALFIAMSIIVAVVKDDPPAKAIRTQQKEPATISVYTPRKDVLCAINPDFIDSSAFNSPANFRLVPAGTELIVVSYGGLLSGRMYCVLSAGSDQRIYVYDDEMDSRFKIVRTIQR